MEPYIIEIIVWAVIVIASIIMEVETVTLTSIWFAIAGLVSLVLAAFKINIAWQVGVFVVLSILLLIFTKPFINKFIIKGEVQHTNADRLFDKIVYVSKDIEVGEIGEVTIENDTWRAFSDSNETIKAGEKVIIEGFDGNKVKVKKEN